MAKAEKEDVYFIAVRPEEEKRTRILKGIYCLYFLILLRVIVFKYPVSRLWEICRTWEKGVILEGLDSANFTFFKTIKMYIRYWGRLNSFENLFGNVLCFVPLGFLLPLYRPVCRRAWVLMGGVLCMVCGFELFQLVTGFGAFDVDDILLNCAGAALGYRLFQSFWRKTG